MKYVHGANAANLLKLSGETGWGVKPPGCVVTPDDLEPEVWFTTLARALGHTYFMQYLDHTGLGCVAHQPGYGIMTPNSVLRMVGLEQEGEKAWAVLEADINQGGTFQFAMEALEAAGATLLGVTDAYPHRCHIDAATQAWRQLPAWGGPLDGGTHLADTRAKAMACPGHPGCYLITEKKDGLIWTEKYVG